MMVEDTMDVQDKPSHSMDEEQYIQDRLEDQLNWYDRKSGACQRRYKWLRAIEIVCAALIPFTVGPVLNKSELSAIVAGALGVTVSIVAGLMTLYKYQENWIKYRTTAESLKHEKFLYQTKTEPYDDTEPFPLLVKRVESLISKENTEWAGNMATQKKEREEA
ncbi:MAG: DUF4231 domain-containing protein [Nitrospiria bacterium]